MTTLKEKTINGVSWSLVDNIANSGITFLVGVVLVRILSPAEFGILGMITVFIAISNSIVDSGFSNALIRLSGLEPYEDIEIKYTGLRPGEKLYEELFAFNEKQLPTHNPKINIARVAGADYGCMFPKINDALTNIYKKSGSEVVEAMKEIVPGYTSKYATTG
jgi:FlaA1/EpsC-like NDP-sugar epimerase